MFQSLSGFQARCNSYLFPWVCTPSDTFQSLSGFQARCNPGAGADVQERVLHVSIPVGFSSSLQLDLSQISGRDYYDVSIPVGFSSSLQHNETAYAIVDGEGFQSLSGFQARCNSCNSRQWALLLFSFNPCRVFKLAATLRPRLQKAVRIGFNPCRVFKLAATLAARLRQSSRWRRFNPCRVFKLAATAVTGGGVAAQKGFNPCRVFKLAATHLPAPEQIRP